MLKVSEKAGYFFVLHIYLDYEYLKFAGFMQ